jgi:hypothetical protein
MRMENPERSSQPQPFAGQHSSRSKPTTPTSNTWAARDTPIGSARRRSKQTRSAIWTPFRSFRQLRWLRGSPSYRVFRQVTQHAWSMKTTRRDVRDRQIRLEQIRHPGPRTYLEGRWRKAAPPLFFFLLPTRASLYKPDALARRSPADASGLFGLRLRATLPPFPGLR